MSPKITLTDDVLGSLTDDQLTRDVWLYQRAKGHRFSSDDLLTAFVAYAAAPDARRVLDLGCGIGSVLLHLAWSLPTAELFGVEAQAVSFTLLQRNIARNALSPRVRAVCGDLRDAAALAPLGAHFDLITGTPPYFPAGSALEARDEQREYARIEHRGGVEAYLTAGAPLLAPNSALVLCGDARSELRVTRGAEAVGLSLRARLEVVARADQPPLFSVWTLRAERGDFQQSRFTLRDAQGARTPD
ncbi:MAG TPA: methyltransferase domain-containing protein, partial [Polyangiaceae bacterium]